MALCFALVVTFADRADAARNAVLVNSRPRLLDAGAHRIPLHPVLLSTPGGAHTGYSEFSVLPVAVGWGVARDGTLPRIRLTAAELSELGHQLYGLLAQLDGYVAAKVGWDTESLVDPVELATEWTDELADGTLDGLVLCDRLHRELGLGDDYVEFRPGYRWRPYQGENWPEEA